MFELLADVGRAGRREHLEARSHFYTAFLVLGESYEVRAPLSSSSQMRCIRQCLGRGGMNNSEIALTKTRCSFYALKDALGYNEEELIAHGCNYPVYTIPYSMCSLKKSQL